MYLDYDVKIKKRPLMGSDAVEMKIEIEDNEITDSEFKELTRRNLYSVIDLWSSKDSQLDFQTNRPNTEVSFELYQQWEDFYLPESDDFKQSFNKLELEALEEFNNALNNTIDNTFNKLPPLVEFIKSEEWKMMNKKAKEIKDKMNVVANMP